MRNKNLLRTKTLTRMLALLLCTFIRQDVFAQNFTIRGCFADVKNDSLRIEYVEPGKNAKTAVVAIDSEGRFSYCCTIKNAYDAKLTVLSNNNQSYFFFVPDEDAFVTGLSGFSDGWSVKGSAFYQKLNDIRQMMMPFSLEFKEVKDKYDEGIKRGIDRKLLEDERKAANREINKRKDKVVYQYLKQYSQEDIAATLLLNLDYKDILPAIKMLSTGVRNGRFKYYIDNIEEFFGRLKKEEAAEEKAKEELEEGKLSPDFVLKDINGDDFQLSSLFHKDKYVLVDFWGSWCSWCIKGFPKMIEYYNKYGDRLSIVGVTCYDKESKWKDAVSKNNIPWLNVFSEDGTTEVRFGVKGYPYKVLISPDGEVIKAFKGETEELYQLLDEKLK